MEVNNDCLKMFNTVLVRVNSEHEKLVRTLKERRLESIDIPTICLCAYDPAENVEAMHKRMFISAFTRLMHILPHATSSTEGESPSTYNYCLAANVRQLSFA